MQINYVSACDISHYCSSSLISQLRQKSSKSTSSELQFERPSLTRGSNPIDLTNWK